MQTLTLAPVAAVGQDGQTSGPEHDAFKKLEGTWTAKVKMGDNESAGTMTYKMECGGLWLTSDFRGEFDGQKFQGRGVEGYDPEKKKYVSVWGDCLSTREIFLEVTYGNEEQADVLTGHARGRDGKRDEH